MPTRSPDAESANGPDPGTDPHADPEAVARKILLDRLSEQPRTRAELAKTLAAKSVPDELAARLLDRFEEVGLIDDAAFARAWVESRHTGRGLTRRALAHELRRKGIGEETVRDAIDAVDPESESEAARTLVRRKLRSMKGLEHRVAQRRLVGMLARRGYPSDIALRVVNQELAAAADELGSPDVFDVEDADVDD